MNSGAQSRGRMEHHIRTAGTYIFLILFCLVASYPLFMMINNSFKGNNEVLRNPIGLPIEWTLSSYGDIVGRGNNLISNYLVSVVTAVSTMGINVVLCAMAAFAFAKFKFKGRDLLFLLLLASVMVPKEVKIPGQYLMFARVGLLDTIPGIILPKLGSIFGVFLIRQYMVTLPDSLIESARIDGATFATVFWRIIVPISTPVLGAFSILAFMQSWNDYLWPSIAIRDPNLQPFMVVLPRLTDFEGFDRVWGTIMAGNVLATLPIIFVFLLFQEKFVSSVTIGAVKE